MDRHKLVKQVLASLREAGLIKVTSIGHEGLWEIELLGAPVSEIIHVAGSLPSPTPSPLRLPPSTPPNPPSYVASERTHETALVNQKTSSNQQPVQRPSRKGGAGNLELFAPRKGQWTGKEMVDFMDVWNGTIVLPKISSMKGRENLLHELLKDQFFAENYREGIKKIAASKFCRGHNRQGTGQRPWKATVDWFLQPHVLPRVIEGMYDNDKDIEITVADQQFTQETI